MKQQTTAYLLGFLALSILFASGCCHPLLYKPTCDPTPILSLNLPDRIDTLVHCPRNETHVENGINKHSGYPQPDQIKEMFNLDNEFGAYRFTLFFNEPAAKDYYEFMKKSGRIPVFSQVETNGVAFSLSYVEQPRSDPEGFCAPMRYYVSSGHVRLRNLVVGIGVRQDNPHSDSLTKAVRYLSDILSDAIKENRK
jgi:hypothetical protein